MEGEEVVNLANKKRPWRGERKIKTNTIPT
jgi:hypothetical protein